MVRFDVISIGSLSRNLLWNETAPTRTAHSTTTLVRIGQRHILVDPGLPPTALKARLYERTGLSTDKIDTVFLTNFRPSHRAGLALFPEATVWIHEVEKQAMSAHLDRLLAETDDLDQAGILRQEIEILDRTRPAEDQLLPQVDLFPLPGYTPGTCGLLLSLPTLTVLVAGDGVPTQDHFLSAQVLPDSYDIRQAGESMREVYEIADLIIPGHDNLFINPRTQGM